MISQHTLKDLELNTTELSTTSSRHASASGTIPFLTHQWEAHGKELSTSISPMEQMMVTNTDQTTGETASTTLMRDAWTQPTPNSKRAMNNTLANTISFTTNHAIPFQTWLTWELSQESVTTPTGKWTNKVWSLLREASLSFLPVQHSSMEVTPLLDSFTITRWLPLLHTSLINLRLTSLLETSQFLSTFRKPQENKLLIRLLQTFHTLSETLIPNTGRPSLRRLTSPMTTSIPLLVSFMPVLPVSSHGSSPNRSSASSPPCAWTKSKETSCRTNISPPWNQELLKLSGQWKLPLTFWARSLVLLSRSFMPFCGKRNTWLFPESTLQLVSLLALPVSHGPTTFLTPFPDSLSLTSTFRAHQESIQVKRSASGNKLTPSGTRCPPTASWT